MNSLQELFERQKRHLATGSTRGHEWRIEQLDRMARLVGENEAAPRRAVAQDFKTASQEHVFETLACPAGVAFLKSRLRERPIPTSNRFTDAPVVYSPRYRTMTNRVRDGQSL